MAGDQIILDSLDREIVRILQVDGRTSNSEIARRTGVTETTVRKRLAGILDRDLIEIVAVPTPRLAGHTISAIIGLSVRLDSLKNIAKSLSATTEVRYCGISTGRYDLIIEAFFSSQDHVVNFCTDVLGAMDGIVDVETSLILKIEKFGYDWDVPQHSP